jgi:hypothetical protein
MRFAECRQLNEVRSCVFHTESKESLNTLLTTLQPCGMSSMADNIEWNLPTLTRFHMANRY